MALINCIKKGKLHLKKFFCIGLVVILTLSLCACGSNGNEQPEYENQDVLLFDGNSVTCSLEVKTFSFS